jgi:hypothetical protein
MASAAVRVALGFLMGGACGIGCARVSSSPIAEAPRAAAGETVRGDKPLLRVDFERDPLGAYTPAQLAADWGTVEGWSNGLGNGRASIVDTDHQRSLRILYPSGAVGPTDGGAQFLVKLTRADDDLYCSYRVRFGPGFNFVRGGKLPGLVGGSRPTGGKPRNDGFSARLMWRAGGAAVQYVYYPNQTSTYGVDLQYLRRFQPGVWHRVEHRVVMNTPGQANGVLQAWFDGQLVLDLHDRVWRLDASVHVDALYFSTFFGGNDASFAPTRDESIDFDDFIVSTQPIGN